MIVETARYFQFDFQDALLFLWAFCTRRRALGAYFSRKLCDPCRALGIVGQLAMGFVEETVQGNVKLDGHCGAKWASDKTVQLGFETPAD